MALLKVRNDQPVELRIAKRLNEKWVRGPSLPKGPWEGSGNRLGSEVPAGVEVTTLPAASQSEGTSFIPENVFEIDSNQPVTTLQLRLRSGER